MKIKEVSAKAINDSRKEKTIEVAIKTDFGNFKASSPTGKSTGEHEVRSYKKSLDEDIKVLKQLSDIFSGDILEKFEDLRRVEDIVDGHVGANTLFALESAVLKAIAKEKKKEIWEIVNPNLKNGKMPRLVGNCVGGGKHTNINGKKPDFQEFLLISAEGKKIKDAFELNKKIQDSAGIDLKKADEKFSGNKNDENAWVTSLNEKVILEILQKSGVKIGLDVASSSFYRRKKYHYENPKLERTKEEQDFYISNLIKNYNLFYIEDPFDEEDFDSFANLKKKFPNSLIVGDDLIVTSHKRLLKAIEKNSVNAVIVKPNQCGSLLEVKQVCETAREKGIKIVFSHRSGETEENILADLAFGFQADFFKCGIAGKEREAKIKRLMEIEKSFK